MEAVHLPISSSYTSPPRKQKSTSFPFLRLPVEIRLAVYEHLLVRDPGDIFRSTKFKSPIVRKRRANVIYPAILQANKLVYNEALEVLYSNNITALKCNADETRAGWTQVIFDDLDFPSLRITTQFHPCLKYAAINNETAMLTLERPHLFEDLWVRCERTLLTSCPNLELLVIHLQEHTDVDMVRRGSETASCLSKLHKPYRPILDPVGVDTMKWGGKFCESMIRCHRHGMLQSTAFKVGCVRLIAAYSPEVPGGDAHNWEEKIYFDDQDLSLMIAPSSVPP